MRFYGQLQRLEIPSPNRQPAQPLYVAPVIRHCVGTSQRRNIPNGHRCPRRPWSTTVHRTDYTVMRRGSYNAAGPATTTTKGIRFNSIWWPKGGGPWTGNGSDGWNRQEYPLAWMDRWDSNCCCWAAGGFSVVIVTMWSETKNNHKIAITGKFMKKIFRFFLFHIDLELWPPVGSVAAYRCSGGLRHDKDSSEYLLLWWIGSWVWCRELQILLPNGCPIAMHNRLAGSQGASSELQRQDLETVTLNIPVPTGVWIKIP